MNEHALDLIGVVEHGDERRHSHRGSALHRLGRSAERKEEAVQHLFHLAVALGQELGEGGEEDDSALTQEVCLPGAHVGLVELVLQHGVQELKTRLPMHLQHSQPCCRHLRAHVVVGIG